MNHVVPMTSDSDLVDPYIYFNSQRFFPWKSLFHMGGRFFCYVAIGLTAQLIPRDYDTFSENSCGVWISFFEACSQTFQFCILASFSYEIDTNFLGHSISCHVLGSIPQCWMET